VRVEDAARRSFTPTFKEIRTWVKTPGLKFYVHSSLNDERETVTLGGADVHEMCYFNFRLKSWDERLCARCGRTLLPTLLPLSERKPSGNYAIAFHAGQVEPFSSKQRKSTTLYAKPFSIYAYRYSGGE
jgi:hypothetical protein